MITYFIGGQELTNSITEHSLFLRVKFSFLLILYFIVPFFLHRHQIYRPSLFIERNCLRLLIIFLGRHFILLEYGFKLRLFIHIFFSHLILLLMDDWIVEEEFSLPQFFAVDIMMNWIFFSVYNFLFFCTFFK